MYLVFVEAMIQQEKAHFDELETLVFDHLDSSHALVTARISAQPNSRSGRSPVWVALRSWPLITPLLPDILPIIVTGIARINSPYIFNVSVTFQSGKLPTNPLESKRISIPGQKNVAAVTYGAPWIWVGPLADEEVYIAGGLLSQCLRLALLELIPVEVEVPFVVVVIVDNGESPLVIANSVKHDISGEIGAQCQIRNQTVYYKR